MLYFLHIHSPAGREPDEEGQELVGLNDARRAAIKGLREIVSHGIMEGEFRVDEWIEIEDAEGTLLDRVRLADIIVRMPADLADGFTSRQRSANDR